MDTGHVGNLVGAFRAVLSKLRPEDAIATTLDIALFHALMMAQISEGVRGGFLEIGVWRGGIFAIGCAGLRPDEIGYAADVFDLYPDPPNNDPVIFAETVTRLGLSPERFKAFRVDTTIPQNQALLRSSTQGMCRFVHIDGGHDEENVRADIDISLDAIQGIDGAIVVLDDVFDYTMPAVTDVTLEFLRANKTFRAFALSSRKLYLARHDWADTYAKYAGAIMKGAVLDTRYIAGNPCLVFRPAEGPQFMAHISDEVLSTIRDASWSMPVRQPKPM